MPHALPFFIYFVVPAPILLGQQLGGGWTFLTPVGLFGVNGALDLLVGRGRPGGYAKAESPAHRIAPTLWLPFQVALIVWLPWLVAGDRLTALEIVGMTFSIGAVAGAVGIVFAHELTHRVSWFERRRLDNGRLEPLAPHHSWDDDHRLSSWLLVNLTHHADHHQRPGERCQRLGMIEGAGKLPFGYATIFLFVLVPPLWFRIMNPRVAAMRRAHPVSP